MTFVQERNGLRARARAREAMYRPGLHARRNDQKCLQVLACMHKTFRLCWTQALKPR
jgi:hypothetical protein